MRPNLYVFVPLLFSISCASVTIRDTPVYVDLGELGATRLHTLSDERVRLEPEEWRQTRFGMFCTTSSDFADNLAILFKLCRLSKKCKFEEKKKLQEFAKRVIEETPPSFDKSSPTLELEKEMIGFLP